MAPPSRALLLDLKSLTVTVSWLKLLHPVSAELISVTLVLTPSPFPNTLTNPLQKGADMVLGHEGVGVVEAVGPEAKYLKKGGRVGWGYEHDSCGHCHECLTGNEVFCPERALYGYANLDQGSFASLDSPWRIDD